MTALFLPAVVLGSMGLVLGSLLGMAAKVFHTNEPQGTEEVTSLLPGANCGGCGFAGCAALARALTEGRATPSACVALKAEEQSTLALKLGQTPTAQKRMVAQVMCSGTNKLTRDDCSYFGLMNCEAAARIGGAKGCTFGCLGMGSCKDVCRFEAISVIDGLAQIDTAACRGCGVCAAVCPRHIIQMVNADSHTVVHCSSPEKGARVKSVCRAGCIGCGLCVKSCPIGAVRLHNHLPVIDESCCMHCGTCAKRCPQQVLTVIKQ